ncbi:MAG: GNAT family N-acetyltransferase [candidate division WOR-3 bacterium]
MQILVREMKPDEREEVKKLFKRSLNLTDKVIFQISFNETQKSAKRQSGGTLIAELDGKIVGAVSTRIQILKGMRTGFIDALVTDKELRGRGIGKSLVDGAISWLEEHGCKCIYATADRYNSPSWNIFIHRGFYLYETPFQLKDYRLSFLRLWLMELYFIGFGTFFLRRCKDQRKPCEIDGAWHLLAALLGVSMVWWIQIIRGQGSLVFIPALTIMASTCILVHELPQKVVARKLGLETTFKAWGSGILFSWLLALLGVFFPAYGSIYVKQIDYWYNPREDRTGIIFAMGPLSSLALGLALWIVRVLTYGGLIAESARVGFITSLSFAILNLIPIRAAGGFVWDGKKILLWKKTVWAALVVATITLIALYVLS